MPTFIPSLLELTDASNITSGTLPIGRLTGTYNINITGTSAGAPPTGSAGGDLSGTYPNPTVAKINGVTLGSTVATSGNILIGSGTQWVTNAVSGDGTLGSTGTLTVTKTNGVAFAPSATTDTTNAANISSGILPSGRLNGTYNSCIAGGALAINTTLSSGNSDFYITFVNNAFSGNQVPFVNSSLFFHPSTGVLTATSFSGSWSGAAALTKTDDTNVTLTLGGTPASALLAAVSLTLGWTGTLSATRINFNSTNLQNSSGALNTIQDITTSSNVQFASGLFGPSQTRAGTSRVYVTGTDSSASAGPHQTYYTASDQYPLLQMFPYAHNNVSINFDSYYDGSWRSSNSTANFQISKDGGGVSGLKFNYNSGTTAGSVIGWNNAGYIDTSGNLIWAKNIQNSVLTASSLVATDSSKNLVSSTSSLTPTFAGLNLGSGALSGTNSCLTFSGSLADGNYINFGTSGRNIGVFNNGPFFFTINVNYDATNNQYVYATASAPAIIELGNTGIGSLKYAAAGTIGNAVTTSTALSWNSSGQINIPGLTASSLVATDGSKNLTSSTSSLAPQFSNLGLGSAASSYPLNIQASSTLLIQLANSSGTNKWQILMQGAGNDTIGFTEVGVSANRFVIQAGGNIGIGVAAPSYALDCAAGDIATTTAGKTFRVKQGSNACFGTGAVLVGGTVTVNTTAVATGDTIFLSCTAAGGTQGVPRISAIVNGTSFTITSSQALDTSTYSWLIIKAA